MHPLTTLFAPIERLINEHGSAAILRDQVSLFRDQLAILKEQFSVLVEKNRNLETENQHLKKENAELKAIIDERTKSDSDSFHKSPPGSRLKRGNYL